MPNLKAFSEIEDCIRWYPCNMKPITQDLVFSDEDTSLYIHIPFCKGQCSFCPFNRFNFREKQVSEYLHALAKEMSIVPKHSIKIKTLWVGGGTPSDMSADQIDFLFNAIYKHFNIADAELTFEAVPGSINESKIAILKKHRVKRISLGVQSFSADYLKLLGRRHTSIQATDTIKLLKKNGFIVNIDLMCRLPNQTVDAFKLDIDMALAQKPDQITVFPFMAVKNTPIYEQINNKKMMIPNNKDYYIMYIHLLKKLELANFKQYTPYHFAKNNKMNEYTLKRWQFPQIQVLALGAGASSHFNGYAYINVHKISDYVDKCNQSILPVLEGQKVTDMEKLTRYVILGLLALKINKNKFYEITGYHFDNLFRKQLFLLKTKGLVSETADEIILTDLGKAFINDVLDQFYTTNNKGLYHPKGVDYQK